LRSARVATSSLTPRAIGLGLHAFEKLGEIAAAGGACAMAGVAARRGREQGRGGSFDVMMALNS
jgi:hypothetical protein